MIYIPVEAPSPYHINLVLRKHVVIHRYIRLCALSKSVTAMSLIGEACCYRGKMRDHLLWFMV